MVFGAGGFLGREISGYLSVENSIARVSGMAKRELVIGGYNNEYQKTFPLNDSSLDRIISEFKPSIIINCAGLIGDRACEQNSEEAKWANASFVAQLAKVSDRTNSFLIHFSSDAVFGDQFTDRVESDTPTPKTIYGKTKLMGENYALDYSKNTLVVRTNFFGHSGTLNKGLFDFFYQRLRKGLETHGYEDVFFNPVLISEIAPAVLKAKEIKMTGILHLCGNNFMSKYRFGTLIAKAMLTNEHLIIRNSLQNSPRLDSRKLMYLNSTRKDWLGLKFMSVIEGVEAARIAAEKGKNE